MKKQCKVQGCSAPVSGHGPYCTKHKATNRRHGAPDQRGITKSGLRPYLAMVQRRIEKNEKLTIWTIADGRWLALVRYAEQVEKTTMFRTDRWAAQEAQKLGVAVEPRLVVETVLAMYLMREQEAFRFKSDRAFRFQLVRRVRGLTRLNAKVWGDGESGRTKTVYSELPPKVTGVLSAWLISVLGQIGVWMARNERQTQERQRFRDEQFKQGLTEIDFQ
ncbi:MAG: hypothetical protein ACR652_02855 [Methylocystis sp.]|uniref:hypothetical protein n=1 Tax=Methylocystis sp. TaxID=1911079 RepID=UPI003DA620A3